MSKNASFRTRLRSPTKSVALYGKFSLILCSKFFEFRIVFRSCWQVNLREMYRADRMIFLPYHRKRRKEIQSWLFSNQNILKISEKFFGNKSNLVHVDLTFSCDCVSESEWYLLVNSFICFCSPLSPKLERTSLFNLRFQILVVVGASTQICRYSDSVYSELSQLFASYSPIFSKMLTLIASGSFCFGTGPKTAVFSKNKKVYQ